MLASRTGAPLAARMGRVGIAGGSGRTVKDRIGPVANRANPWSGAVGFEDAAKST
jgi:hypothetical protein